MEWSEYHKLIDYVCQSYFDIEDMRFSLYRESLCFSRYTNQELEAFRKLDDAFLSLLDAMNGLKFVLRHARGIK